MKSMKTNPVVGIFRTLSMFMTGKVTFYKDSVGKDITMEDGKVYTVFRHVQILSKNKKNTVPEAVFKIRFTLENMGAEKNVKYSRLPMMVFMGFHGFRSKLWAVNYETNECQGIYEWQTHEDAVNYSKSIAVKFMTQRSKEGSVGFEIIPQTSKSRYFAIEEFKHND